MVKRENLQYGESCLQCSLNVSSSAASYGAIPPEVAELFMVPPVNTRRTKLYGPYRVGTILSTLPLGVLWVFWVFVVVCTFPLLTQLILISQKVDTMIISIVQMKK